MVRDEAADDFSRGAWAIPVLINHHSFRLTAKISCLWVGQGYHRPSLRAQEMSFFHFVLLQLRSSTLDLLTEPELLDALRQASGKRTHTVHQDVVAPWRRRVNMVFEPFHAKRGVCGVRHIWALSSRESVIPCYTSGCSPFTLFTLPCRSLVELHQFGLR